VSVSDSAYSEPEWELNSDIKVSSSSKVGGILKYVHKILVEEKFDTKVTLSGIGEAITNVVATAELVWHRIRGIHAIFDIISV